jgi:hypothetical protein
MADNQQPVRNPFEDDKPRIVHLEKDQSHYEYCRMQMHEIDNIHKRTFFFNLGICILVCLLAVFHVYIGGFDVLKAPFLDMNSAQAVLTNGIFQILISMVMMVLGYLAWANFRTLNIFMIGWYVVVTVIGVIRLDYMTAVVGAVGVVVYFFSLRAMSREAELAEMDGYPEFHEKFDISQSDIVIATLMAHKGEHRTKSTLFTTDYSLRRKKKRRSMLSGTELDTDGDAGEALAEELQKHLSDVRDAKQARTAIATLDAVTAARERDAEAEQQKKKQKQDASAEAEMKPLEDDAASAEADEKPAEPEGKSAEPEEKSAEPEEKPAEPEEKPAEPEDKPAEQQKKPAPSGQRPQNAQSGGKKKKKKRH